MTSVATKTPTQVARPLSVLVPLIKDDLQHGEDAARAAGMEYYRAAGEKMIEAKSSPEMKPGMFVSWLKKNFNISQSHAWTYMEYARVKDANLAGKNFSSLSDFKRSLGHVVTPGSQRQQAWHEPVKESIEQARRQAARIEDENLSRQREKEEKIKLCLRMIDIGYKILSKELHPDKGGSRDAMARLNDARNYAKAKLA